MSGEVWCNSVGRLASQVSFDRLPAVCCGWRAYTYSSSQLCHLLAAAPSSTARSQARQQPSVGGRRRSKSRLRMLWRAVRASIEHAMQTLNCAERGVPPGRCEAVRVLRAGRRDRVKGLQAD